MKFMLDSNVIVAISLARGQAVRTRMAAQDEGSFVISAIAFAEVIYGSHRGLPPGLDGLEALVEEVPVLPFDEKAALAYATLPFKRASYDRLIAAHALSLGLIVVTDNLADYSDIPGLKVENWALPL